MYFVHVPQVIFVFRSHDDYIQADDLSSSHGALYSVSQRVPSVSASYGSLCATDATYPSEQGGYSNLSTEWDCEPPLTCSDGVKDASSDVLSDKQANGKFTYILTCKTVVHCYCKASVTTYFFSTSICLLGLMWLHPGYMITEYKCFLHLERTYCHCNTASHAYINRILYSKSQLSVFSK